MRRVENRNQAMQFLEQNGERLESERERSHYIIPSVTEVTHRGEREWHIFSRLLKDRIVSSHRDDDSCQRVIAPLCYSTVKRGKERRQLYVNALSSCHERIGIFETCSTALPLRPSARQAASLGAVLRPPPNESPLRMPNARHGAPAARAARASANRHRDPGARDQAPERVIVDILVEATGKSAEQIAKDIDRDFYLQADEAKEYGLIDEVIPRREKVLSDSKKDK